MDINELRKHRAKLQDDLTDLIAFHVKTFEDKTGFTPKSIDIDMMNISTVSSQESRYQVGGVSVDLDI